MGAIFFGIAILAIVVTGLSEYRRHLRSQAQGTRTSFAKKDDK